MARSKYIQSVVKAAKGRPKSTDWFRDKIKEFGQPKAQTKEPIKNPKRKTRKWFGEVKNWGINQAKWRSAEEYCKDQGMEFKIFTEDHINPKYK